MAMDTESGALNLPVGSKATGQRVDFKPDKFVLAVETKGYRLAWSRAAWCPCSPINDQTDQPDPTCSVCRGSGWFYFAPAQATVDTLTVGNLTGVQSRILADNAAVIRGIMTGISQEKVAYDPIGSRVEGTMNVTVRHENRLGYHDRITNLDSEIVYMELLEAGNPNSSLLLETRYPIVRVNLLRSSGTIYTAPTDFTLDSNGSISWVDVAHAPSANTRLVCHYLCHPTWLIVQHPHSIRLTPVNYKTTKPTTPLGDPQPLPIQAVARYEFLPELPRV